MQVVKLYPFYIFVNRCWKVLRTWKRLKARSGRPGRRRSSSTITAGPWRTSWWPLWTCFFSGRRRAGCWGPWWRSSLSWPRRTPLQEDSVGNRLFDHCWDQNHKFTTITMTRVTSVMCNQQQWQFKNSVIKKSYLRSYCLEVFYKVGQDGVIWDNHTIITNMDFNFKAMVQEHWFVKIPLSLQVSLKKIHDS